MGDIPHSEKRFPGYDRDSKEYDADAAKYKTQFAAWIAEEIEPDDVEDLYKDVHKSIREDPSPAEKEEFTPDKSFKRKPKISLEERKAKIEEKRQAIMAAEEEDDDEEEDDE